MIPPEISRPDALKGVDDLIRASFEAFRNTCFGWLLISTGIVVLGLLLELPEIWLESKNAVLALQHSPERHIPAWVKLVVSLGWFLIVVGVSGEFVADAFVSKADGFVQKFDEILLADAQKRTGLASERAARAFERAAQTEREASQEDERAARAEQQASEENARAAKALEAAEAARKNAEGFSLQIAKANERAANAEARASEATLELARINTARSLTHVPELISSLEPFKGTEYVFVLVFQDEESILLLREIDDVLQKSGWIRGKSVAGFPALNIYGKEKSNFSVPAGFNIGILIFADSPQPLEHLDTAKITDFQPHLQAAAALQIGLSQCLVPPSPTNLGKVVNVDTGTSTTVRIAVGRKP